ncbi:unnamed protein product [Lupinus luteus]|uniref:Retrotransposon Copia-like N-terminal domain-containing protein n=1 Tax=Lupinus luteus TaxID=3873 RepID=A0AAV1WT56_LUPLU
MTMALETKNKLEFVNETLPKPLLHDPMYAAWKRCNNLVVSWLNHSVGSSIVQSVLWLDTAQEIWEDLHQRYHQGDALESLNSLERFIASGKTIHPLESFTIS